MRNVRFFEPSQQPFLLDKDGYLGALHQAIIVDVRDADEFSEHAIHGAFNVSINNLDFLSHNFSGMKGKSLMIFHCKSGRRTGTNLANVEDSAQIKKFESNRDLLVRWAHSQGYRAAFIPKGFNEYVTWNLPTIENGRPSLTT
jgi:rhodanese-related sulfurtransferase